MFLMLIRRQNIIIRYRKQFFSNNKDPINYNLSTLDKIQLHDYMSNIEKYTASIRFWAIVNGCIGLYTIFYK